MDKVGAHLYLRAAHKVYEKGAERVWVEVVQKILQGQQAQVQEERGAVHFPLLQQAVLGAAEEVAAQLLPQQERLREQVPARVSF